MKSMSMVLHGISRLNCVCKCNNGFCRIFSPLIHILAGEKVCIHVIIPIQFFTVLASWKIAKISSGDFTVGLKTTFTGICFAASNEATICWEWFATCFSVSSPYKCWLPVTNQTSNFFNSFIFIIKDDQLMGTGYSSPAKCFILLRVMY